MVTSSKEKSGIDLLFDARHIRQSGIGTYIATLLPELEDIFATRSMALGVLAADHAVPNLRETTVVRTESAAAPMYTGAEQKVWNRAVTAMRPQALWVPHYPFPLTALRPRHSDLLVFATVHDTLHVMDREISGQNLPRRMYARTMLNLDQRKCRMIFTPSSATAASLTGASSRARVMVTPIPVEDAWFQPVDATLSPVPAPYILYVGNAKWHKNLPLLLKAYAAVAQDIPQKLVIAGSGEALRGGDERVTALATEQGDRVEVMGRLDFDVLRALVAGADLLIMPSLHEGAGLPPIEAMASRTAVLASHIAALRETCGDGADYFDPNDDRALARLLRTHCLDDSARSALAQRGWSHVTTRQSGLSLRPAAEAVATELASS